MQLFGADATMFFLYLFIFFAHENMKKPASKVAEPAQIQPKSQFLFHKNLPPRDSSVMTVGVGCCCNKMKVQQLQDLRTIWNVLKIDIYEFNQNHGEHDLEFTLI